MSDLNNLVESTIPLRAIKSAVELQHTHANMELLNTIISDGLSTSYLGADGKYHAVPALFDPTVFLQHYNQVSGNVKASKDADNKLILNTVNTFAASLDNKVIGSIELEQASNKQINVSIAEVDVNSGEISENPIKYIKATSGATVNFDGSSVVLGLVESEQPFIGKMDKQPSAVVGAVGTFDSTGQIVNSATLLSALATKASLTSHEENTDIHVTKALQTVWSDKQTALTPTQLSAANSGITQALVIAYDSYGASKQSIAGNPASMNVVTDASGNISTEPKFDMSTKVNTVPTAVHNRVATFTGNGNIGDSGVILGNFSSNETVRQYIDTSIYTTVSGSSYQGTFNYFGTKSEIEAVADAKAGDTAVAYEGTLSQLGGLLRGNYDGTAWTFAPVVPAPTGGAWMEIDNLLTQTPSIAGRVIVRMDGVNPPALDVRPATTTPFDNVTIGLDSLGQLALKMKFLSSGKSVMNSITSDSIAYEFTNVGGTDTSLTIKQVIDANKTQAEPVFTKNSAFNKNFDTAHQTATSSTVIGDKDIRLSNARPANDVAEWAKAANKPVYTAAEVGLGNVNNTSDLNKPISTATREYVDSEMTASNLNNAISDTATLYMGSSGVLSSALPTSTVSMNIALTGTTPSVQQSLSWTAPLAGTLNSTATYGFNATFTGLEESTTYTISNLFWRYNIAPLNISTANITFTTGVGQTVWSGLIRMDSNTLLKQLRYASGSTFSLVYTVSKNTATNASVYLTTSPTQPIAFTRNGGVLTSSNIQDYDGTTRMTQSQKNRQFERSLGAPYVTTVSSWSGTAGAYYSVINHNVHNKGIYPSVITQVLENNQWVQTYDSPGVDAVGAVTVYSNSNAVAVRVIIK